ncbi:hypothetical protein CB0101_03330 [Synechococcus sp. CB0101]|jgi:hypothetical protein|uniref:hypothetical protein n=1 Tax=Synechococcus sp. CB0101 TaxID=232348 RepID=UPI000A06BE57|nr:hypothetical protein [Synechococcus sp. CB0101]QCH14085.1 hypothetical protein CB0101_03330 [Synechococcus sp. CB0101]
MTAPQTRGRWVAIITGAISILIAAAYLVLITVLDSRGPLLPPPPEAMGLAVSSAPAASVAAVPASADAATAPPLD